MDLGGLRESPQGIQSSSQVGACTCTFLRAVAAGLSFPSRGSRDLGLSLEAFPRHFPTMLSHQAFPRGCPTVMSHVPQWCQSILGLKVEAVQGKQVSLEWTEKSGGLLIHQAVIQNTTLLNRSRVRWTGDLSLHKSDKVSSHSLPIKCV